MIEGKKQLELTVKQRCILAMIIGLMVDMPSSRIRKIHAQLDKKYEKPPSHKLVSTTIQKLEAAKVLEMIEFKALPGEKMKSALYEWNREIFESYEVVIIKQKKRKAGEKKQKDTLPPPIIEKQATPEDWYSNLKKEIREKEAQHAALGEAIAELKKIAAEVDESIENVRKCFPQRGGK